MSRITFRTNEFKCHILCDRCTYVKDNGERCKNRVCFGIPVCWVHTIKEYGIKIKKSTLPGVGKGLFSTSRIERDTWICPYIGESINEQCLNQRYPGNMTAPYAVKKGQRYEDSACMRGSGAMANGKFRANGQAQTAQRHNAVIRNRPGYGLWIWSTKNILRDREIFVHYGGQYRLENNHVTKRMRGPDTRPC